MVQVKDNEAKFFTKWRKNLISLIHFKWFQGIWHFGRLVCVSRGCFRWSRDRNGWGPGDYVPLRLQMSHWKNLGGDSVPLKVSWRERCPLCVTIHPDLCWRPQLTAMWQYGFLACFIIFNMTLMQSLSAGILTLINSFWQLLILGQKAILVLSSWSRYFLS